MLEISALFKSGKDSSESENESLSVTCKVRKNRRKNLMPQKAVQCDNLHVTEGLNLNETEDVFDMDAMSSMEREDSIDSSSSMSESEILSNICNDEILLELQENPVNEEILNQLNEEDIFPTSKGLKNFESDLFRKNKDEYYSHRSVKCNMCEQVFQYRSDFDKHYLDSYGLPPVYTCTFCNKTAEKYSTFRSHCYRHITEGRFKCNNCMKGFNLKSLLHIHILTKHSKIKPFSCDQCGKKFVTKPGLRIHKKKHKTETKEDYPCVICGKILHTRGGLTSHMNVHRLGRRFMCDVCGKTFTQKVNMQQHVKQHTGDKPHVCDKCGKTFVERSHLSRHYILHSDRRPFKCDICQKMYKTERCLKVHNLVHASERPFVCKLCNKGFLSSTKLKQHSNIHTGERPYRCKFCERTFTNYPNLLKHNKRKHKAECQNGANEKEKSTNSSVVFGESSISEAGSLKSEDLEDSTFLNVALTDEKYISSPNCNLVTNSNEGVQNMIPYSLNSLPSHQSFQPITQETGPIQLSDLLHIQYLHQSIPDVV